MPTTCLLCYQEQQYFLMPPCNHTQMCWKCCLKLIEGSTFSCPFCKDIHQGKSCILFVSQKQMKQSSFQQIFTKNVLRSSLKSYQFYSNQQVARFIEEQTSFFCRLCFQIFQNVNLLKKHLNITHARQFCDVCLENRKCLVSQQILFTQGELIAHQKRGQFSEDGELILYHPFCEFCKIRFYDIDALKTHLRISSHLKCHICDKNFPHLKYVYYKDIDEIQKHFKKSHFMCSKGACIQMRLQNVFVSQAALEDHENRFHNKIKGKRNDTMNLILFQGPQQEQAKNWDGIGKDLTNEFKKSQKHYQLSNQQHFDELIDIRQYYPQKVRFDNRQGIRAISDRLQNHLFSPQYRSEDILITSIPFFTPMSLDCQSLPRFQIEKLIKKHYDPKFSEQIISTFFQKKHQFKNMKQYFVDIKRKMSKYNKISFYYIFPQLIRFLRNQNPAKALMDSFYAQQLRQLKISKQFIFHKLQNYSDIFLLIQEHIESYIYEQMFQEKIDINIYEKYLLQLNNNFYSQNYQKMFYVPKQKIVNLYHMIQKCKTKQLPKLNWLLKIGFRTQSIKIVMKQFFYKTINECRGYLQHLDLRQTALLYSYCGICLQALLDKNRFKFGKQHSTPLFFTQILHRIPAILEPKKKAQLEQLQRKSLQINIQVNHKHVGMIINQIDHPSLLRPSNEKNEGQQFPSLSIPAKVNLVHGKKRRLHKKKQQYDNKEEYPSLINPVSNKKQEQNQEQQFPVYNYQQNYINKKNREQYKATQQRQKKIKKRMLEEETSQVLAGNISINNDQNIRNLGLFTKFYRSEFKQDQNDRIDKQKLQNSNTKDYWQDMPTIAQTYKRKQPSQNQNKKVKKQKKNRQDNNLVEVKTLKQQPIYDDELIIKKKSKQQIQEQQQSQKKKKKKRSKIQSNPTQLTQAKQKQQKTQQLQTIEPHKKRARLDLSNSEQKNRKKEDERKKIAQEKRRIAKQQQRKIDALNPSGFDSLIQNHQQQSIVNKIIKSNQVQQEEPQIKIKKRKKGKAVVIQKFDIFKR